MDPFADSSPAWETHLSLALGILALLIGLWAILPMLFGRPAIRVEFEKFRRREGILLQCCLFNKPLKNGLLRLLGVTRATTSLSAVYSVFESGTNRQVLDLERALIRSDAGNGILIELPVMVTPAVILIVWHSEDKGATLIRQDESSKPAPLQPGRYYIRLYPVTGHQQRNLLHQEFVVGEDVDSTYWA